MTFKNMKIAITDNDHLKAVCDALESIGYKLFGCIVYGNYVDGKLCGSHDRIITTEKGYFTGTHNKFASDNIFANTTLSDLLKIRDEMELLK